MGIVGFILMLDAILFVAWEIADPRHAVAVAVNEKVSLDLLKASHRSKGFRIKGVLGLFGGGFLA